MKKRHYDVRYDVFTSREVAILFKTIWKNTYELNSVNENTKTKLAIFLGKKIGPVNNQIEALKDAGLLTRSDPKNQKLPYLPNVEVFLKALCEKRLEKNRLDTGEIKAIAFALRGYEKEIFVYEENDTLLNILERTATILKPIFDVVRHQRSHTLLAFVGSDEELAMILKLSQLDDNTIQKMRHLKVPGYLEKVSRLISNLKKD